MGFSNLGGRDYKVSGLCLRTMIFGGTTPEVGPPESTKRHPPTYSVEGYLFSRSALTSLSPS